MDRDTFFSVRRCLVRWFVCASGPVGIERRGLMCGLGTAFKVVVGEAGLRL